MNVILQKFWKNRYVAKKVEMYKNLRGIASFPPGLLSGFRGDDVGEKNGVIAIPEGEKQSRNVSRARLTVQGLIYHWTAASPHRVYA